MLVHVVLFSPRADLTDGDRTAFAASFEEAVRAIPTVRRARVGRRVVHGAGYERGTAAFELLAMLEFDDLAGLLAYLHHPAHAALGARFGAELSASAVYDFELASVDDLVRRPPSR